MMRSRFAVKWIQETALGLEIRFIFGQYNFPAPEHVSYFTLPLRVNIYGCWDTPRPKLFPEIKMVFFLPQEPIPRCAHNLTLEMSRWLRSTKPAFSSQKRSPLIIYLILNFPFASNNRTFPLTFSLLQ